MCTAHTDDLSESSQGRPTKDCYLKTRRCARLCSRIAPKLLLRKHSNIGTKKSSLNGPFSATLICPQQSCGSPKSMDRAAIRIFPQSIDTASTPSGAGPMALLKTWPLRLHLRRHIPLPGGRIYNVGEAYTPTISERLAWL